MIIKIWSVRCYNCESRFILYQIPLNKQVDTTSRNWVIVALWSEIVMRCAIWYHLYDLKNVKNTHGRALLLVKLQASAFLFHELRSVRWLDAFESNCSESFRNRCSRSQVFHKKPVLKNFTKIISQHRLYGLFLGDN